MRIEHWFYELPLRMRSLFRRPEVEQELDEELQYHIDRQAEQLRAQGLSTQEARQAALRAMGGLAQRKEECRDTRRVRVIVQGPSHFPDAQVQAVLKINESFASPDFLP